jgi:amidase
MYDTVGSNARTAARCFMPYPDVPVPGAASGPLHGLTLAVKDLFDVAGYPTSCGSPHKLAASGIKSTTAPIVQAMLDNGARFVGKTVTDEFAYSLNGKNAHFGTPRNGAAPDRIPGGSSSGSASAVSNGLADIGLGSDTGGSVRGPASYNGIYGIRPSHGAVDDRGCMPLAPSFDTVGWMARSAAVLSAVGRVLLPEDRVILTRRPRVLIVDDIMAQVAPEAVDSVVPVMDQVAAHLGPIERRALPGPGIDALFWTFRHLQSFEAWQSHGDFIETHAPPLGPGVLERMQFSSAVSAHTAQTERAARALFRAQMDDVLAGDTIMLYPTMPDIAPLLASSEADLDVFRNRALRMLCVAGLAGLPQISLPMCTRNGASIGLSIVGPKGSDRSLLALAEELGTF